jgi:hypothetical protein
MGYLRADSVAHTGPFLVSDAAHFHFDAENTGAGGDVERVGIFVAPGYIADALWHFDGAEVFAFRGDDPDAAATGTVDISLLIDANAIGAAFGGVGGAIEKYRAIGDRAIRLDAVAKPLLFAGVGDVEVFFVGGEGDAVVSW